MQRRRIIIAHGWIDVSLNIQTKKVAYKLCDNWDVWFFTQPRVGKPVLQVNDHLVVMQWPNKRPTGFKDLLFCIKQIRRIRPETVVVHFGATKIMMLASWLTGVKNRVAWYHTLSTQTRLESKGFFRTRFNLFVRTLMYAAATKIVVQNQYAAKDAMDNHSVDADKIVKIENGLDKAGIAKESYDYGQREIKFLYLGRLHYTKGCDFLIKVFATLVSRYPNVSLKIVGGGEIEGELKGMVNSLGATGRITLSGPTKDYESVFAYLNEAYALVVPSRTDNFPTVVFEAFSYGVPVIGSKAGGIPEMIDDKVNGYICESENEEQWIEKLSYLIEQPSVRNEMAVNARDIFEKRYTMQRHVENVEAFVNSL